MKRTLFIAIVSLVAACGSKKDKGSDTPPVTSPVAVGSAAMTMAGSGSAATMAGSGSAMAPTMAGSGSAATMAGSGGTMAGSADASKPTPTAAKGKPTDIPSTADYEAKAKAEVTDKNVDSQLKDLEKDLPQ